MSTAVLEATDVSDAVYPISLVEEDKDFFNKYGRKLPENAGTSLQREHAMRQERYDAYMAWQHSEDERRGGLVG